MLKVKVYFLLAILAVSASISASEDVENISCVSIHNQIALHLKSKMDRYIVTKNAISENKCPTEIFFSIKDAKETEINGWKVFYGEPEKEARMTDLSLENEKVFQKKIDVKPSNKDNRYAFSTFQLNASSISAWSQKFCSVYLAHEEKVTNVGITFDSGTQISTHEFCLSIPTILAVNGLKIIQSEGTLKIVISKNL